MDEQRLFLATPLPNNIQSEISKAIIPERTQMRIRWIPENKWHLTVFFIGEVPLSITAEIIEQLKGISNKTTPYSLDFEKIMPLPKLPFPKMVWARFYRSEQYANQVYQINDLINQFAANPKQLKKPTPHITLARVPRNLRVNSLNIKPCLINEPWLIDHFELWESKLEPTGAVYRSLKRFPFNKKSKSLTDQR